MAPKPPNARRAPAQPWRFSITRELPQTLQPAAVDVEGDAGDEARALGAEKRDGVGELLRAAPAAERVLARGLAPRLVLGGDVQLGLQPGGVAPPHARVHPARAHGGAQ